MSAYLLSVRLLIYCPSEPYFNSTFLFRLAKPNVSLLEFPFYLLLYFGLKELRLRCTFFIRYIARARFTFHNENLSFSRLFRQTLKKI